MQTLAPVALTHSCMATSSPCSCASSRLVLLAAQLRPGGDHHLSVPVPGLPALVLVPALLGHVLASHRARCPVEANIQGGGPGVLAREGWFRQASARRPGTTRVPGEHQWLTDRCGRTDQEQTGQAGAKEAGDRSGRRCVDHPDSAAAPGHVRQSEAPTSTLLTFSTHEITSSGRYRRGHAPEESDHGVDPPRLPRAGRSGRTKMTITRTRINAHSHRGMRSRLLAVVVGQRQAGRRLARATITGRADRASGRVSTVTGPACRSSISVRRWTRSTITAERLAGRAALLSGDLGLKQGAGEGTGRRAPRPPRPGRRVGTR